MPTDTSHDTAGAGENRKAEKQLILVADDNESIVDILTAYARKEGYDTAVALTGQEAVDQFHRLHPALILLDVMMPVKDGFAVCREIRQESDVPVIMITARAEDEHRIMGLDIGADDYVVKPFSPGEVMARIRAVLRRMARDPGQVGESLHYPGLDIHLPSYSVILAGDPVRMTRKEFEMLWLMASHPDRVFTRDNLLDSVWGNDYFGDARTVDTLVKRLRAKLDQADHPAWSLQTIWGVGYQFKREKPS
jgi:DNA-binding response OmpR family regulator